MIKNLQRIHVRKLGMEVDIRIYTFHQLGLLKGYVLLKSLRVLWGFSNAVIHVRMFKRLSDFSHFGNYYFLKFKII